MNKILLALSLVVFTNFNLTAQTLKVKCNTYENLQLCLVGKDAAGHHATSNIYDVTYDESFSISLYKAVLGYDYYKNSEMVHEKMDSTWRWDKMFIYNNNVVFDSIDISMPGKKVYLQKSHIYAQVKHKYDREYLITEVSLSDN